MPWEAGLVTAYSHSWGTCIVALQSLQDSAGSSGQRDHLDYCHSSPPIAFFPKQLRWYSCAPHLKKAFGIFKKRWYFAFQNEVTFSFLWLSFPKLFFFSLTWFMWPLLGTTKSSTTVPAMSSAAISAIKRKYVPHPRIFPQYSKMNVEHQIHHGEGHSSHLYPICLTRLKCNFCCLPQLTVAQNCP